jgi:hypothetical protein
MRARSFWAGLLVLPAVAVAAPAPETYTIKLKHNASPGKTVTIKDKSTQAGAVKVTDADGKVLMENKIDTVIEKEYTEKVLVQEKDDKRPKKYTQTYKKAVVTNEGKKKELSYQGRTIIYEIKDGKYEVTAEGDPALDKEDLNALKKEANNEDAKELDEALIPKKAVKVGESWTLDQKKLLKAFGAGSDVDASKSKAEATLTKAYKKNGKQYGIIDLNLKLAVKSMQGGLKFDPPAMMDMKFALDVCIDGTETAGALSMTAKLKGKAVIDQMGMKFTVDMSLDSNGKKEQSAEK